MAGTLGAAKYNPAKPTDSAPISKDSSHFEWLLTTTSATAPAASARRAILSKLTRPRMATTMAPCADRPQVREPCRLFGSKKSAAREHMTPSELRTKVQDQSEDTAEIGISSSISRKSTFRRSIWPTDVGSKPTKLAMVGPPAAPSIRPSPQGAMGCCTRRVLCTLPFPETERGFVAREGAATSLRGRDLSFTATSLLLPTTSSPSSFPSSTALHSSLTCSSSSSSSSSSTTSMPAALL
mmetsp:Transcript_68360/g.149252  ORF Transcript_68360/g.149252 Transcript_68360/m.149252 type:complete len:239 (+) Transcript_68360:198-914(+)